MIGLESAGRVVTYYNRHSLDGASVLHMVNMQHIRQYNRSPKRLPIGHCEQDQAQN